MPARRADLLRMRRLAHALDGPREASPTAVVDRLLAVQAQDFAAACFAVAVRTERPARADVLAELDAGSIVRSWPMRGTLHFVPARDLGWMLSLTSERMVASLAARQRNLGLDQGDFGLARDLVVAALEGGRSIDRASLMDLWEGAGLSTEGQRGYHLIYYLSQIGVLCWGPTHRTQQSLVLLDEWVTEPRSLEPDEAWAEFLYRYLAGHGPATIADFVWWTKGTVAGAKRGLAVLGDAVTSLTVDGTEYLVTAELADRAAQTAPTRAERDAVHLLPAFDEYLLGYRDRDPVLDPEHFERIVPGGNGVFAPIIVARGRVIGTWKRRSDGTVDPVPFEALSTSQERAVARAVESYRRYVS